MKAIPQVIAAMLLVSFSLVLDRVLNESRNGDGTTLLIRYSLKGKHDN